jgi:hypothetical protein
MENIPPLVPGKDTSKELNSGTSEGGEITLNEFGLSPQHEIFCNVYARDSEKFGNITESYAEAYGYDFETLSREPQVDKDGKKISGSSDYDRSVRTCAQSGSRLYRSVKIRQRIADILNEFLTDKFVDSELTKVIQQDGKLEPKVAAIREFNKLRGRLAPEKVDQSVTFRFHEPTDNDKGSPDTLPLQEPVISGPDLEKPSEIRRDSDAPQIGEVQDGPKPADPPGNAEAGALPVSAPDIQTG